MAINEFDKVRIKKTGIVGTVVDVHRISGETVFIVESDKKGVPGGYGDKDNWKLFDCLEGELEKL